jgi:UPF0716 protein FxsA
VVPLLFVLFVLGPIAELAVIIKVGQAFGVLNTLALMVLVGIVGAWLVKREGMARSCSRRASSPTASPFSCCCRRFEPACAPS